MHFLLTTQQLHAHWLKEVVLRFQLFHHLTVQYFVQHHADAIAGEIRRLSFCQTIINSSLIVHDATIITTVVVIIHYKSCSILLHRVTLLWHSFPYLRFKYTTKFSLPKIACPAIVYVEIVAVIDPFFVGVCPWIKVYRYNPTEICQQRL